MEKSYRIDRVITHFTFHQFSLERFFSLTGNIKTDWRCGLKEESVEVLARITIDGPNLKEWAAVRASNAIEHWYKQKNRRIEQSKRKPDEKRQSDNVHKSLHEKDFFFCGHS